MRDRWRTVATIGFIVVLLVPGFGSGDSVPLSSYPMYASPRSPEITFVVPAGLRTDGSDIELSSRTIAGTSDPLIAETYLRREVEAGRVEQLCRELAQRVDDADISAIEIRAERHNVVDRVVGQKPPVSSAVLASCPVP